MRITRRSFAVGMLLGSASCSQASGSLPVNEKALRGFASDSELDAFFEKLADRERVERATTVDLAEAPAEAAEVAADAAAPEAESITNTQEAGVDEGGIVKRVGDYLVILRRGRIFTVRHGGDTLAPIDQINAFPPSAKDPSETWYDEMLVKGTQIIVIGYSYGEFGTEVNRFDLSDDGKLSFRDTRQLRSGDYYSSSNYASRLIGDELIMYTPIPVWGWGDWGNWRELMPAIRKPGRGGEEKPLVQPEDFLVAEPLRGGEYDLEVLHTVTRCDLAATDLDCTAKAIFGSWSHAFYVSRQAVYIWTGQARTGWSDDAKRTSGQLYRVPLDGGDPSALGVEGAPIDQFSFAEDAEGATLRVLLRDDGHGEGMWASEATSGDLRLAEVSLNGFGNGSADLPEQNYRKLPGVKGLRLHNRYVGDWLLYSGGAYGDEARNPFAFAVPLAGGDTQKISLPHGVTRFDKLGSDGVAIGPAGRGALGFSSISLGNQAKREDTYLLPSAGEGETRSQAFFYRADRNSEDGLSGTLGLPVSRKLSGRGAEFLGSSSAMFFLRRNNRKFAPAGELAARSETARKDKCIASCVDWYGNARPIFMEDRIFALMGYEIVEGVVANGKISEKRRISFAP